MSRSNSPTYPSLQIKAEDPTEQQSSSEDMAEDRQLPNATSGNCCAAVVKELMLNQNKLISGLFKTIDGKDAEIRGLHRRIEELLIQRTGAGAPRPGPAQMQPRIPAPMQHHVAAHYTAQQPFAPQSNPSNSNNGY